MTEPQAKLSESGPTYAGLYTSSALRQSCARPPSLYNAPLSYFCVSSASLLCPRRRFRFAAFSFRYIKSFILIGLEAGSRDS